MLVLDGNALSKTIKEEIKITVDQLRSEGKKIPHLAAVLVGSDGASETYVGHKVKSCEQVGFKSTLVRLADTASEAEVMKVIDQLNADADIDGYIVQLPLPKHIDSNKVLMAIDPKKDVDGFHPVNIGRLALNLPSYVPATPMGIMSILERYNIETAGKHCVVLGRSNIVGRPMSILMSRAAYPGNATVTLCHSQSSDLKEQCLRADIIIAAIGKPGFLTAGMVKEGAVVIDVGITRVEDASKKTGYRISGDVDYEHVAPHCSAITPVPGGVGPMTVTSLLINTLKAANHEIYSA
jgi:methylenetetrahydrofolate dehydrogenase (NADP+) / methenyltetrahydrofolate cyclohydrolase